MLPLTELRNKASQNLDTRSPLDILNVLHRGQVLAAKAVEQTLPDIALAAHALADTMKQGGNLVYVAAGSSALMGLADALELPGTFGIDHLRIKILLAGGDACLKKLVGGPEDNTSLAEQDFKRANITSKDIIIALSASGRTPYVVKCVELAGKAGAKTIGLANNDNTPILAMADIAVLLSTPSEILAGSTRMGAGTAQKIALNMMSTLMAVHLGHIHDGYMVNVATDNIKLKQRAKNMVMDIAGCSDETAIGSLEKADGSVKIAILLALGAVNSDKARELLEKNDQNLRSSISALKESFASHLNSAQIVQLRE